MNKSKTKASTGSDNVDNSNIASSVEPSAPQQVESLILSQGLNDMNVATKSKADSHSSPSNISSNDDSNQSQSILTKKSMISISSSNIIITTNDATNGTGTVTSIQSTSSNTIPLFGTSYPTTEADWPVQADNKTDSEADTGSSKSTGSVSKTNSPPFTLPPFSPSSTTNSSSTNSNTQNSSSHLLLRHPDAIPTLISLLSSPNREVHEQAMWILGSIAAGEGASSPIPNPSSSSLTNFANANNMPLPNSASSSNSLSNSPSSVAQAREQVLQAGAMEAILSCLEASPHKLSLQRIGSWTLSNLVDVQYPQPNGKNSNNNNANNGNNNHTSNTNQTPDINIKALLPTLKRLLYTADAEVLSHTCWALSHLCDRPSSHISVVVSPAGGLVPRLVELLLHPSWRVTKPALRTIGNVVCAECVDDSSHNGDHHSPSFNSNGTSNFSGITIPVDYTETILECGAVPRLKQLITHGNREIQKEACWTLSNIAAGAVDQIQAVIDSGAIAPLVKLASDPNADQEVRSEACWVVLNATSCGSDAQIEVLVKEGCVSVLGVLLGEQSMVMMALEGLERVLQVEESKELQKKHENEGDMFDSDLNNNNGNGPEATSLVSASLIEALEQHKNSAVAKRAGKIWKQHFVSCALCRQSFSRHRLSEARFCKECKCHVCKNCNCEIYHLSYQEEFWAATEEKTQAKSMAKKSKKNKKKKKKKKQKQQSSVTDNNESSLSMDKTKLEDINDLTGSSRITTEDDIGRRSRSSTVSSYSGSVYDNDQCQSGQNHPPIYELAVLDQKNKVNKKNEEHHPLSQDISLNNIHSQNQKEKDNLKSKNVENQNKDSKKSLKVMTNESDKKRSLSQSDDENSGDAASTRITNGTKEGNTQTNKNGKDISDIDLVNYLQQTGSIIALSRLLDQLDGEFSITNLESDGDSLVHLDDIDEDSGMLNHGQHIINHSTKA